MKLVGQRRVGSNVEWRDADVGGRKDRRNVFMRHGTNECNAVEAGSGVAHTRQFRAAADEHRLDIVPATRAKTANRIDQLNCAVPLAKGTCKDRDGVAVAAGERYGPGGARAKASCISSPFGKQDLRRRHMCRDNFGAGRHDHIGLPALPVAPTAHRFDDERAVDHSLPRSRMIDDRCIYLEYGERAHFSGGENPFPAEVVVALDDDIWLELPRVRRDLARAKQPESPVAKRRRQPKPLCLTGRKVAAIARRHEDVHIVPQSGEPFGDGRHVHRSAMSGRHRLVDG